MKVAACIYGLPRGNKHVWSRLKNTLILPLSADVYVHTWRAPSGGKTHHGSDDESYKPIAALSSYWLGSNMINVRNFHVEKQFAGPVALINAPWGVVYASHQCNAWASILGSMADVDSKQYDWVCFTRFDCILDCRLKLDAKLLTNADLLHFGRRGQDRYEAEDVLFFIRSEHLDVLRIIRERVNKNFYTDSNIYNVIIHEFDARGLRVRAADELGLRPPKIYRKGFKPFLRRLGRRVSELLWRKVL